MNAAIMRAPKLSYGLMHFESRQFSPLLSSAQYQTVVKGDSESDRQCQSVTLHYTVAAYGTRAITNFKNEVRIVPSLSHTYINTSSRTESVGLLFFDYCLFCVCLRWDCNDLLTVLVFRTLTWWKAGESRSRRTCDTYCSCCQSCANARAERNSSPSCLSSGV